MELTADQKVAAKQFSKFLLNQNQKVFVLEGYSGCGKTTLTKYLLSLVESNYEMLKYLIKDKTMFRPEVALTATTHKAATELSKQTGQEATTIHSFLKLRVQTDYRAGKTKLVRDKNFKLVHSTILFVDEASMVDQVLFDAIKDSTEHCKLVLIGDPKQLLHMDSDEAIAFSNPEVHAKLSSVVRQAAGNPIIQLATDFRKAIDDPSFTPDISQYLGDTIINIDGDVFQSLVHDRFSPENYQPNKTKILCWTNRQVNDYNGYIRRMHTSIDTPYPGERLIANAPVVFGNKILIGNEQSITVNSIDTKPENYLGVPVFSLYAIGIQEAIKIPACGTTYNRELNKAKREKDWYKYFSLKDGIADLRPPYASTIHKAQGSTVDEVFLDLNDISKCKSRDTLLRLLYVGCTRPTERLYIYGDI